MRHNSCFNTIYFHFLRAVYFVKYIFAPIPINNRLVALRDKMRLVTLFQKIELKRNICDLNGL